MVGKAVAMHISLLFWLLVVVLLSAGTAHSADEPARRGLLATGDVVPLFGVVGTDGFKLLGIADDGRLLVGASLNDGRLSLLWADTGELSPIWTQETPDAPILDIYRTRMSGAGYVVAPIRDRLQAATNGFRIFDPDGSSRDLLFPQHDVAGHPPCAVGPAFINDHGVIAFEVSLRNEPACRVGGVTPSTTFVSPAILVSSNTGFRAVFGTDRNPPPSRESTRFELLGIAGDGSVLVSELRASQARLVRRVRGGKARTVIRVGDMNASGTPLTGLIPRAMSSSGEILFAGGAGEGPLDTLYRTKRDAIIRVMSLSDAPPEGTGFEGFVSESAYALNNNGDVLLTAQWTTGSKRDWVYLATGVLLYPVDTPPIVVFKRSADPFRGRFVFPGRSLALNNRGHIAFLVRAKRSASSLEARRVTDGEIETLLRTSDAGPDGTILATHGLEGGKCLAPDGRVAIAVQGVDGTTGLLCGDVDGFHLIAEDGDRAPTGDRFTGLKYVRCMFTDDGDLLFSAETAMPVTTRIPDGDHRSFTAEAAVFEATRDGITRIVGVGDRTTDEFLLEPFGSGIRFSANEHGEIVFVAITSRGTSLFHAYDGRIEKLTPPPCDGVRIDPRSTEITRDGTFLSLGTRSASPNLFRRPNALVAWGNEHCRIVMDSRDPAFDGVTFDSFQRLLVRGNQALFTASYRVQEEAAGLFLYAGGGGPPVRILVSRLGNSPENVLLLDSIDFVPGGPVLVQATIPSIFAGYMLLHSNASVTRLTSSTTGPIPFAVNARNNIGFVKFGDHESLQMTGPMNGDVRCPVPPRAVEADCQADCNADNEVSVSELVTSIAIALGQLQVAECPVADADGDARVAVDELISGIDNALAGCPQAPMNREPWTPTGDAGRKESRGSHAQ